MERLVWRSASSQAKSIGTAVSVAGAFVTTFYEGPAILVTPSNSNSHLQSFASEQSDWVIGGLFLGVDCVLASLWLIVQVKFMNTKYVKEERKAQTSLYKRYIVDYSFFFFIFFFFFGYFYPGIST